MHVAYTSVCCVWRVGNVTSPHCVGHVVGTMHDADSDKVLIEGVLFRANYLGSTQMSSHGLPTKMTRMMQAQEAVNRVKVFYFCCSSCLLLLNIKETLVLCKISQGTFCRYNFSMTFC